MLNACDYPGLPEKIDDDYLLKNGTGQQPEGIPSLLDAFIVSIRVFEVVDRACNMNCAISTQNTPRLELSQVFQLNEKADEIESSLPPHLRFGNDLGSYGSRSQVLQLQAEGVRAR